MNRQKLQALASDWTRVAKNDIRQKINDFMQETDASRRELAYMLGISDGELEQIINGNGEITLSTFAKLLIATGNALEIKPIEATPIGSYDNIPEGPMPPLGGMMPPMYDGDEDDDEDVDYPPMPRRNPFRGNATVPPMFRRPTPPRQEQLSRGPILRGPSTDEMVNRFDRVGRPNPFRQAAPQRQEEAPQRETRRAPQTPFDGMSREKMIDIIRQHLWDSEIDLNRASREQLVAFLAEKDRRVKENKRLAELENDPQVNAFKERLKKTVSSNPHLRKWVQDFIGNLDE